MPNYSGLLIRDNFPDSGVIPATGDLWISPDIIPYGTGSLAPAYATSTYGGPDIGQPIVNHLNNNVYIRCKNISGSPMTGTVTLSYANSSLFLYPTTWQPIIQPVAANVLVTATSTPSATIPNQAVGMVQAPFTLGGVPANAHYCFISVVNNNGVAFPVPSSFSSNAAFNAWVANNPNVAFRNIVLNPGSTANVTSYTTFGNANQSPSQMIFSAVGTNLPNNATWQASCNDARLAQPFAANGAFSSSGTASTQLTVPPNITGGNSQMTMAWTFSNPSGQPFPSNAAVTLSYYQIPTPADQGLLAEEDLALERAVSATFRIAARNAPFADAQEEITLILLGSVAMNLHS